MAVVAAEPVLRLEREFASSPERVYAAWTDPRLMAQWLGPDGVPCADCRIDLRPGGRYRAGIRTASGGEHWVGGEYREIVPNRRLVFTWQWEEAGAPGHEMLVTVEFRPQGTGTRMLFVQTNFASEESCRNHEKGWSGSFAHLQRNLSGA
jgi:uncharacterized protein YndB with AHSA1/START domain